MAVDATYPGHTFIRDLGSGNFGVAKLFRNDSTGEQVAVKFLVRGKNIHETVPYVEREVLNHMQLSGHPNIVKFREVFITRTHLAIAMDYASGGELFDKIVAAGQFSEDVARYFFQQLISGVAWCHSNGVCHRDLKLENSLLDKRIPDEAVLSLEGLALHRPHLKICDFGYSKSAVFDSQPKSTVGTPAYIAPEVLNKTNYDGEIADVWSCGVTLYVMLVGAYPFEDPEDPRNVRKTIERIAAVHYQIPRDLRLSTECWDLISRIFVADPAQRITLGQIQQHPWFLKKLPPELKGGDLPMRGLQQFKQSEDDIRNLIVAACTLPPDMQAAQPKAELQEYMDYIESNSHDERLMDQYLDAEICSDEFMYLHSTGQAGWQQQQQEQQQELAAGKPGTPAEQEGGPPRGPGTQGRGEDSAMAAMAGMMGGLGIGPPGVQLHPSVDPDLLLDLEDY